jgi:hypothetical protein
MLESWRIVMAERLHSFVASEAEISWTSAHVEFLSGYEPSDGSVGAQSSGAAGYALLAAPDRSVRENLAVRCPVIRPSETGAEVTLDRVCILLHGLNERGWDKYYDWARAIADKARCAVILFPLAFHMDRAPSGWADFGIMRGVSKDRVMRYPGLRLSSMANSAISERLDRDPSRFFRSGLMSARDLSDLILTIESGGLPGISTDAKLGFFGYSIGAYLLQCMTIASEDFAAKGKRFLFCGGPYLSSMTPISKFIMDSRAHERIIGFWVENLEEEIRMDTSLGPLIETAEGRAYCAMVDPRHPQLRRREAFSDDATKVVGLCGDEVMPRRAIESFFKATAVAPRFLDLPPVCTHIAPFNPLGGEGIKLEFDHLFYTVAEHLFG